MKVGLLYSLRSNFLHKFVPFFLRLAILTAVFTFSPLFANAQYPVVAGTNSSSQNSASNTHSIALPGGIQAGDLLIILWADANTNTYVFTPSGWSVLYTYENGNYDYIAYYRIAVGPMPPSVTVFTSSAERSAHNSYRIAAGTFSGGPVAGTVVTGYSQNPDPNSFTSGFGPVPTLWIAASHSSGDNNSPPVSPVNYSSPPLSGYTGSSGFSHVRMLSASRQLTAASEDPGAFTLDPVVAWGANTIAIKAAMPTITLGPNPSVCSGATSANLSYSATTMNPDQYTIDWDAAAEAQGFVDAGYTALPASPIVLTVPAGAAPGTYNAILRVSNSTISPLYESQPYNISVIINPLPTCAITGNDGPVCPNASFVYSAPAGMSTYAWSISGGATISGSASSQNVTVLAGSNCDTSFTLSLTITDPNGCLSSCQKTVDILDNLPPTLNCPAGITVACDISQAPPYSNYAAFTAAGGTATDNCGINTSTFSWIGDVSDNNTCPENVTRSYRIEDRCGYADTCTQIITIDDNINPVLSCPAAPIAVCNISEVPPYADYAAFTAAGGTATDNCGIVQGTFTWVSDVSDNASCPETVTRTYSIQDSCGNTGTCTQAIIVDDNVPPVVSCPPPVTVLSDPGVCYATGVAIGNATATDNCGVAGITNNFDILFPAGQVPVGVNWVVWTATDLCGNSDTCHQKLTVNDGQAPVILNCPSDITEYTGPGSTVCGKNVTWTPPTASDNCGTATLITTHSPGAFFPVGTTTVTYTATDASGNQSFCIFDVTVIDNTPPTFTPPINVTIYLNPSCTFNASPAYTGYPGSRFDNCGLLSPDLFSDDTTDGVCPGEKILTRTWTVRDIHGNSTSLTQVITVLDNLAPLLTVPINIMIQCHEDTIPANTGQAVGVDNCGGPVVVSHSDIIIPGGCPNEYTIQRTWTATDCRGNVKVSVPPQIIQVRDDLAPYILFVDHDTVECPGDIPFPDISVITAVDNCGEDSIIFYDEIPFGLEGQPGYCPDSIHRIYKVWDYCGNWKDVTQRIIVLDKCDCSPCADTLSFYTVDFDGDPYGDTTIFDVVRQDKCCDAEKDYCASFNVRLDDDAIGVIITVDGAAPSPQDWRVDCNEIEIYGDTICLPGGDFHLFTYCKPGQNENDFRFQSIAGVVLAGELTTRVECETQITVDSNVSNPTWTSVYPGYVGQYNSYLSCLNCYNPVFTPDEFSPPEIFYRVCGGIPPGVCNQAGYGCDTVIVHVLDSIYVEFDVDPGTYCRDEIPEICATVFPPGVYYYRWFNGPDSTGTIVGTDSCYLPPDSGYYSLVVTSILEEIPCSVYLYNFHVAPDDHPPIVYPPDSLILECKDPLNPQLIADWLALAWAEDDHTPHPYVYNDYTGIDEYCNSSLTVHFWSLDSCDNVGTDSAVILIIDTWPPVIECPPDAIAQIDSLNCFVTNPPLGLATATDDCPGVIDIENNATPTYPPGEHWVIWTATDACGNQDTCWQKLIVVDLDPPSVICPDSVFAFADPGVCDAYVNVPPPIVTDPCPVTIVNSYTGTSNANGTYPVGHTTVIWTITGPSGIDTTCNQVVTVIDNQPPEIICPNDTSFIAEPPECEVPDIVLGLPTYYDNCPDSTLSWAATGATTGSGSGYCSLDTLNVGVTIIIYTVTDASGNTDTCSFKVTVNDQVPPTIIYCPENVTTNAEDSICEAYVTVPQPQVTDSCGEIVTYYNNSPYRIHDTNASGTYPVGIHTVTWTFVDASGNDTSCTHLVTVIDNQPPVIICPPDVEAIAEPPGCEVPDVILEEPTVWDNCDTALTWTASGATTGSGSGLISITTFNTGITYLTYVVTDPAGLTDNCTFTVTVSDLVPPTVIACSPDTTVTAEPGLCEAYVTVPPPMVIDSCDEIVIYYNNSPYRINDTNSSGTYPVGEWTVTWTFVDQSGNDTTCIQVITVVDDQLPSIICPPDVYAIAEPPECEVPDIVLGEPEYYDNCPDSVLSWEAFGATTGSGTGYVTLDTFYVGVTTIVYTVTDASGNTDTCSFKIVVNDEVPPTIIDCPNDTTVTASWDSCAAYVNVEPPEVIDPCGEIVTYWHNSPYGTDSTNASGIYPVGVWTVTWTFEDESGNDTTCVQVITVLDVTDPQLICPDPFEWPADFNMPYATNVPVDPPVYSDSCGVETLTWEMTGATTGSSPPTGINELTLADTLYVGVTTVTYTAIDANGNISTCSFTITITSKPEIICPNDTMVTTDPGVCWALLDPGVPIKVSGIEPIEWTWYMTGATVDTGTGIPILPNPYTFNLGTTQIIWVATNISGSDTCYQEITVIDNQPPTYDTAGPYEFCVLEIFTAVYDGQPEPLADFDPDRPDWYIIDGTTELDLINLVDNCCDPDSLTISWVINFSNGYPAISGTGQPSAYGPITLWGTTDHTVVIHTITYVVEDCNGNFTSPLTMNIKIKPRPYLTKPD